jgi:hypothetical protein
MYRNEDEFVRGQQIKLALLIALGLVLLLARYL